MKWFVSILDEVRYPGLAGIALGVAIGISGITALLMGGIWITWRLWDAIGLPTLALFRAVARVGYWPAFAVLDGEALKSELTMVGVAFVGWFAVLTGVLWLGRKIREIQGEVIPR